MIAKNKKTELFEIILPFTDNAIASGPEILFDDCPLCQQLKHQIESGEVESIPIQVEMEEEH